jgi:hypothetical protein
MTGFTAVNLRASQSVWRKLAFCVYQQSSRLWLSPMKSNSTSPIQSNVRFPAWQEVYEAALRETDRIELFKLVEIAEATILSYRDALVRNGGNQAEEREIENALQVLLVIKQARLSFPTEITWAP